MSVALLLDENIPRGMAEDLRGAGHDVWLVAEVAPGIDDVGVLALARETDRWLLTFDSDFGDLIYRHGVRPPAAVLYFRVQSGSMSTLSALAVASLDAANAGHFCVIGHEGIRRRPLPPMATDAGT